MSTIDTSTWSPDSSLNTDIGGIPLNSDASIAQTWQAIQMLMAALKGDTANIMLGTASRAVVTDANKKLAVSSVTATELGRLSGVTSSVQTQLNGKADVEDVSSTFTWESGESPAKFFAYRIGKSVHVFYQGASKTHSQGDSLGSTTLITKISTFIPFVKNATAYGELAVDKNSNANGSNIKVNLISSSTVTGRIYVNGAFLIS